jgi:putative aldouronate transport system substrate-binding protein
MKKLMALAVALLMLSSALPLMGSGAADELEPYVIDFWMLTNAVSNELPLVTEAVNNIIEPKFNATLNLHMIPWGDWWTQVSLLNAGEKCDILFTADWWQYTQGIANNYFLPLNDLMEEYASETMAQLGETFITGSQFKGINYAVPTDKELAVNGGFLWNKTLADKYGLVPDPTWKSYSDWEPLLEVIKENEPDVLPILADGNWYHIDWIGYVGCDIGWNGATPDDPTMYFAWEADFYTQELYAARDMFLKGYIERDAITADNEYNSRHLTVGDFFLTTQPLKPAKGKSTELMSQTISNDIVYDEFETYPLLVNTTHCGGSMYAIASTSEDPARAMMFINELHVNPDLTNALTWGVEGVTYEVAQEEPVKLVKPIEGNTWVNAVNGWMMGNFFNIYLAEYEPLDKYELLAATKVGIPGHVANGYRFDSADWLDTMTAVNNTLDEYVRNLRVGAVDPDETLPELISSVEAAGFRDYFGAVQADFQAWLDAK